MTYRKYSTDEIIEIAENIREQLEDRLLDLTALSLELEGFKFRAPDGSTWTVGPRSLNWYQYKRGSWFHANPAVTHLDGAADFEARLTPSAKDKVPIPNPDLEEPPETSGALQYVQSIVEKVRSAYESAEITSSMGESLLENAYLADQKGILWTIGYRSGEWYTFTDDGWARAAQPPDPSHFTTVTEDKPSGKFCPSCGHPRNGDRFCQNCGVQLAKTSENNGSKITHGVIHFLTSGAPPIPETILGPWNPPHGFPEPITECPVCHTPNVGTYRDCIACESEVHVHADSPPPLGGHAPQKGRSERSAHQAPLPRTMIQTPWKLKVIQGNEKGQTFPVSRRTRLGRDPKYEIRLTDKMISRLHAVIEQKRGAAFITDQGSTNGTFVNGLRITQPTRLQSGDTLTIGDTKLLLEADAAICSHCGTPVRQSDRFCRECGQPVGAGVSSSAPGSPVAGSAPSSYAPSSPPKRKQRSWVFTCSIIILLLVCGVISIGAILIFLADSGIIS